MPSNVKGANAKLGLPRQDKMEKFILCFDVDGTLIQAAVDDVVNNSYTEYQDVIASLVTFSKFKNVRIVVWSGGGKQYAETWVRRLNLEKYVWRCASKLEHEEIKKHGRVIAIDDIQDTAIGDINLIVRNK